MQLHHISPAGGSQLALVGPGGRLPLDRRTIETLAELFVGLLDLADGDPDVEHCADEDEPGFDPATRLTLNCLSGGSGCLISDPDDDRDGV